MLEVEDEIDERLSSGTLPGAPFATVGPPMGVPKLIAEDSPLCQPGKVIGHFEGVEESEDLHSNDGFG